MKIIDLLNKIANGEEVPEKIKIFDTIFKYSKNDNFYFDESGFSLSRYLDVNLNLNDKVEILEEEKKIPEKLDIYWELQKLIKDNNIDEHNLHKLLTKIEIKQNEIIDCLDYLKSKGDE